MTRASSVGQTVCTPDSGEDPGAQRIVHTGDGARHLERAPCDEGADDVGVVSVGGRRERIGALDAGFAEDVPIEGGAHDALPGEAAPQKPEGAGSSSMTTTSWPSATNCLAMLEPTRPQPTMITYMVPLHFLSTSARGPVSGAVATRSASISAAEPCIR